MAHTYAQHQPLRRTLRYLVYAAMPILLAMAVPSEAASVLLAEFKGWPGGMSTNQVPYYDITAVSFGLGYSPDSSLSTICVGCELPIPIGQTGAYTFDASTSPQVVSSGRTSH